MVVCLMKILIPNRHIFDLKNYWKRTVEWFTTEMFLFLSFNQTNSKGEAQYGISIRHK